MPSPIRALLFLDDDESDEKKPRTTTTTTTTTLRDGGVARSSFLSKWSSFLSRKTTEISIPVAFDKQKSNFLIGPSALWWRDAFAISSSLLRGGDDDGEENKNNSEEKEDDAVYENGDAAMADLGHAAEATLDLARVVSGTLLADLRRCAMLISFFLPFAFEFDSSGGVLRVYLFLLFVSRGVLSSTHFVRTRR